MKPLSIFTFCLFIALNGFSQEKKDTTKINVDTTAFTKVDIEAEFPGGLKPWAKFLNKNLRYPGAAFEKRVQGTVIVQFIVDKDGTISNVEAISGPQELREETERIIKISPKWTPASQEGRQVKSYKKQPITFRLE